MVRAQDMQDGPHGREAQLLADVFCRRARLKVKQLFYDVWENADDATYKLAQGVLKGDFAFLEEGAVTAIPEHTLPPSASPPVERKVSGERPATRLAAGG